MVKECQADFTLEVKMGADTEPSHLQLYIEACHTRRTKASLTVFEPANAYHDQNLLNLTHLTHGEPFPKKGPPLYRVSASENAYETNQSVKKACQGPVLQLKSKTTWLAAVTGNPMGLNPPPIPLNPGKLVTCVCPGPSQIIMLVLPARPTKA